MKRRDFLAAGGAAALASAWRPALAQSAVIRQGYQTNMWGMPTYYLLRSGALEKQGLKYEEFAVPSGNITMQQMVGRQVDLGTYAGPSFLIGHARGQLVAIAQIDEPVWLAIFLPRRSSMRLMPSSLRAITRVVLPTSSICAMATSWPRAWPIRNDGPA